MTLTELKRDGARLNQGTHWIGRFTESCSECGEIASHMFGGATFGPREVFYCGEHAALVLLASAGEADDLAVTRYLLSIGFTAPVGFLEALEADTP